MPGCEVCFDLNPGSAGGLINWKIHITDDCACEHRLAFESAQFKNSTGIHCSVIQSGICLIEKKYSTRNHRIDVKEGGTLILREGFPLILELKNLPRFEYFSKRDACQGTDTNNPWIKSFGISEEVPPKLSIKKCKSIIDRWIKECDNEHSSCCIKAADEQALPSRLLDIRKRAHNAIILVEVHGSNSSESRTAITRYATLSHCWGKIQLLKTTKNSLSKHKKGIRLSVLPKTFRESIKVLQALRIQFVWINSLCIVQDDDADWKRESACMAAIYSNSYLNIAATGARDSKGGCLKIRCLKRLSFTLGTKSHPITDQYRNIDWGIRLRPSFESVHHRYNSRVSSGTDVLDKINTPLLSRAWVFQERQLAPRTLHFHPSELVMKCKSGLRCECTILERMNDGSGSNSKDQDSLRPEAYEIFNQWNELVREYSRLLITRESDRLIALIGIATQFQRKVNCGYLAGLWSSDIANGLLWDITGSPYMRERMDLRRIKEPFAPTWSWTSLVQGVGSFTTSIVFHPGQVLTPDENFKYLGTNIPYSASEWHNMQGTGCIKIQCLYISAIVYKERKHSRGSIRPRLVFKCDYNRNFKVNLDVPPCVATVDEICSVANGTEIYCLLVARRYHTDETTNQKTSWLHFLICTPLEVTAKEIEISRIGVCSILEAETPLTFAQDLLFNLV
ncbi:uncharacterized protein EAE97_001888 [Botrytis byssoidea]|uniref:Heterokaryon incompatibility domain-containing protein n=1 Tax=Botrytis byssoidea TaxID=139641 RepID=A0A9P5IVF0_9HELO|nr:uncharacterized protein EAE97_001888 [Botrytis byssoidea]KAF7952391.1 hypothetical protein EAE97_001888 [Botrytis byssoidea]